MTSTEPRATPGTFQPPSGEPTLARRLGAFDATMKDPAFQAELKAQPELLERHLGV